MRQDRRRIYLVLAAIALVALLVRALSFCGNTGSDDAGYALIAHRLATGQAVVGYGKTPVFPLRIGLFGPVALLFRAVGTSEAAMLVYPFAVSCAEIALAFFTARLFFGMRAGIVAAALVALLPIEARSATQLLPDLPASFWANLGIVLLYVSTPSDSRRRRLLGGLGAGAAFAAAWLCKETVLYLAPFIAILLVTLAIRQRRCETGLACASVVIVAMTVESLFYHHRTHDFLFRYHELERNYKATIGFFSWEPGHRREAILVRIFEDGPKTIFLNPLFGFVPALAAIALAWAAYWRDRAFLLVGAWFVWVVLIFNFGSSSLASYLPLLLYDRYLFPVIIPATALTAGLLCRLWDFSAGPLRRERRFWAVLAAVTVCAGCLAGTMANVSDGPQSRVERTIASRLRPSDRLYTDERTAWVLSFFWKYPATMNVVDFTRMDSARIPRGARVLINRSRADYLHSAYGYALPAFYERIPPHWTSQWQDARNRAELFSVGP